MEGWVDLGALITPVSDDVKIGTYLDVDGQHNLLVFAVMACNPINGLRNKFEN